MAEQLIQRYSFTYSNAKQQSSDMNINCLAFHQLPSIMIYICPDFSTHLVVFGRAGPVLYVTIPKQIIGNDYSINFINPRSSNSPNTVPRKRWHLSGQLLSNARAKPVELWFEDQDNTSHLTWSRDQIPLISTSLHH